MLLCQVLPVQAAQTIDGEGGDDPLLSEVWWDDVLPWLQQPISCSIMVEFDCYFWSYARSETVRALSSTL
jgi:hypothetical protein